MKTTKMILIIVCSLLIIFISQVLAHLISDVLLMIKVPEFICSILSSLLYIMFTFYLLKLLCSKFLKDDLSSYYITNFKVKIKWLVVAIALPVIVSVCFLFFNGSFEKNVMDLSSKLTLITTGIFFTGIASSIVEEMVFRGIIMSVIEKRFNKFVSIIIPSFIFSFAHLLIVDVDLLSSVLVILAGTMVGIMYSLITVESKSIWNSVICHTVWNIIILGGIVKIGSINTTDSLYSYVLDTQSFLLTGGEFGIEASIFAVVGYCLVCLIVIFKRKELKKL